jgi:hypothetical protein
MQKPDGVGEMRSGRLELGRDEGDQSGREDPGRPESKLADALV